MDMKRWKTWTVVFLAWLIPVLTVGCDGSQPPVSQSQALQPPEQPVKGKPSVERDEDPRFASARRRMVEQDLAGRDITDARVLEVMGRNLSVQNKTLMLYEIGNTFFATGQADSLPDEKEMLAALWTGERTPFAWHGKSEECDFFDIKGIILT